VVKGGGGKKRKRRKGEERRGWLLRSGERRTSETANRLSSQLYHNLPSSGGALPANRRRERRGKEKGEGGGRGRGEKGRGDSSCLSSIKRRPLEILDLPTLFYLLLYLSFESLQLAFSDQVGEKKKKGKEKREGEEGKKKHSRERLISIPAYAQSTHSPHLSRSLHHAQYQVNEGITAGIRLGRREKKGERKGGRVMRAFLAA